MHNIIVTKYLPNFNALLTFILSVCDLQSSGTGTRLRRSASASRRDSKDAKYREKIAELEDIIRHQTKQFEQTQQVLVRYFFHYLSWLGLFRFMQVQLGLGQAKHREKIAELEDIIKHQTKQFERTQQVLVRYHENFKNCFL